ncbi:MAG: Uma2 family endonuclease [Candidatus Electrothrix aestuarii]|uniref:Uma2 family endonuclease n=1 Tax=Candidatus Electrothrix aestuarii TaxID=3062594 RepID=A0AAU8LR59_9BACT|nr:Uma2 family endonuclease [Candidatus Electrothrix aestuarii]
MQTESKRINNPPPNTVSSRHYMRRAKQEQGVREQFLNLPEGTLCQLIAGEIIMTPSPVPLHQIVIMELSFQMLRFAKERDLGQVFVAPLDVSFNEKNIFQPDILFIRKDNLSIIGKKMIEGVPDCIVEVLSPSSAYHDLRTKFRVYEQSGVLEYWIVDINRQSIELFANSGRKFQLRQEAEKKGAVESLVLDGFSVTVDDLF